ncbi:MAG: ABC transporter permease [Acidobacteria bacterium]|nr:ABC transporter permease [Acidobacteriota bacterium]
MSSTPEIVNQTDAANTARTDAARTAKASWALWIRQTFAILNLEIRKNFLSRRALLLYLIAGSPLVMLTLFAFFRMGRDNAGSLNGLNTAFAAIYGGLILRTLVFFGCAWVFMNLFRGEVIDRSLHYYFLAPVRREVLVAGKYLSGLIATVTLFGITTVGSMLLLYFSVYPAESARFFFEGAGAGQLLGYLGVTVLACIGYGSAFLLVGLFFRNPIIPAGLLYGWEWINFLLPPVLKKVSVIHYLHSLVPVPMSEGPLAVLAEPTPAWIAVPGLLVFTGLVLVAAALHIRRMEISYAGD